METRINYSTCTKVENAQDLPKAAATYSMIDFRNLTEVAMKGKEASCDSSLVAERDTVESGFTVLVP